MPTLAGFLSFIRSVMGIDPLYLPDDSVAINWAYSVALMIVNPDLTLVTAGPPSAPLSVSLYELCVYNLAGDNLINYAPDQPGRTFFAEQRKNLGISTFAAGVVSSTSDDGDSVSLAVPDSLKMLTMAQLQNLKTPYGRTYLGYAQTSGTLWGLT